MSEIIKIPEGLKKMRKGNLVIFDIDYLLSHLSKEIYLLEHYRQLRERIADNTEKKAKRS